MGQAQTHLTYEQLAHRFQFHPADSPKTQGDHRTIRDLCLSTADKIVEITGAPTREQSIAITKLEEAMFWANAAIARNGPKA